MCRYHVFEKGSCLVTSHGRKLHVYVFLLNICASGLLKYKNIVDNAGAMSFEDGLRLVKLRGESMQAAADAVQSGMVSVIGLDKEKVAALCEAATKEVSST